MSRSPHKRKKAPALPIFERYRVPAHFYGRGYTLGYKTAHLNGLKPGDTFLDPKGKKHVVPSKKKRKKDKTRP